MSYSQKWAPKDDELDEEEDEEDEAVILPQPARAPHG